MIYLLWRLFEWTGNSWVQKETQQLQVPNPSAFAPWPLLLPNPGSNKPPYNYSDSWSWTGDKWKFEGCVTSFKSDWCAV